MANREVGRAGSEPAGKWATEPPDPQLMFGLIDNVPLPVSIGVIGHRPNRLRRADREVLGAVLGSVLDAACAAAGKHRGHISAGPSPRPLVRAISPLAEGADRLFAEQAISRRLGLLCLMPYPQAEYERDFEPGNAEEPCSLARFRSVLASARDAGGLEVVEYPGIRDAAGSAYAAVTAEVVRASDLLTVVWDGEWRGSSAGTEGGIRLAWELGVPALWIHADAPHAWQVLERPSGGTV